MVATAGAGTMILVLGMASLAFTGQVELAVWLVAGIVFGGFRYAATALFVGSAAESGRIEDATTNLAAAMLVGGLAAPVGTLLWSAVIGGVSADAVLIVGGVGAVVGALVVHLPASTITGNHRGGTRENG